MLKPNLAPALALAMLLSALPAHADPRTTERTFPAPTAGVLSLAAKHGGEIRISGWDKPEIHVLVTDKKGNYKVDFVPAGANLEIRGSYDGPKLRSISTEVVFEIQVPRTFDLRLSTDGGGISLQAIEGSIRAATMGGNLKLVELAGTMDIRTMGGNIEAAHCSAVGPLRTSGGNVAIANARGGVDVETMGGNIRIGTVDGPVKAHTSGGTIEILLGPEAEDCSATTNGGDITLKVPEGYSAHFRAHANGMPRGRTVECTVPGLDMSAGGTLGDGAHQVDLRTDGGTIRIVPAS
jgi:hypothetical protein